LLPMYKGVGLSLSGAEIVEPVNWVAWICDRARNVGFRPPPWHPFRFFMYAYRVSLGNFRSKESVKLASLTSARCLLP
jgi:hypothetical protein